MNTKSSKMILACAFAAAFAASARADEAAPGNADAPKPPQTNPFQKPPRRQNPNPNVGNRGSGAHRPAPAPKAPPLWVNDDGRNKKPAPPKAKNNKKKHFVRAGDPDKPGDKTPAPAGQ